MKNRVTYVHSYSFHKSMHSNGSGQMTFEHGLFDGQLRSRFLKLNSENNVELIKTNIFQTSQFGRNKGN